MKYLLLTISILFITSTQAEVYKWVDDKGTVHYGDKPQAGSKAVDVEPHETIARPATAGEDELSREEKRQRVSDMLEEDRLAKNKEREKQNRERERKKRECNRLKDTQRRVQHAGSLYRLDEDGNRVTISNEQRQKSEKRLRQQLKKACS
jgi:hypothetical protein